MRASSRDERGQALPLVALLVGLCGFTALVLGRVGAIVVDAARARTAADAAALAGAAAGRAAAADVARENGAALLRYREQGQDVDVVVRVERSEETARARRVAGPAGARLPGAGGLAPGLTAALTRAAQLLGRPVPVASGYRSPAQQAALYARRASNPYPVARPGSSMHERGLAVDVPSGFLAQLLPVAAQAGLCRPYPRTDPVHFELCRPPKP